jgi:hypothetical protein
MARDKKSKNTPQKASLKFWFSDENNRVRIILMPVMAFIAIRFVSSWFPVFSRNMEFATSLGLVGDFIFIVFREIRWQVKNKLKIRDKNSSEDGKE